MTTINQFPKQTIRGYDVVLYALSIGKGAPLSAIIYRSGSRQAVWECAPMTSKAKAFAEARKWIAQQ